MIINSMEQFQTVCEDKLLEWYFENGKGEEFIKEDIFIVWSCKTLQNYKCLVSTTMKDGIYAEYTYNGDKQELYEDVYKKETHRCLTK